FALLSAWTAVLAAGDQLYMRHAALAIIAWIAGMLLILLGTWKAGESVPNPSKKVWLTALILFILAFALRAFDTQSIPKVLTGDEGSVGLSSINFNDGLMDNIFVTGWFDFPSLYFYFQSLSISVFGQTIAAMRLPSALIGALTVSAVYLFGSRLFDRRVGLVAAIFMTGFHFHIHFSRLGLNNIWDSLWYIIILGALYYGWKTERRWPFLLTGAGLALSQYFYVSSRALFVLIPAWLFLVAIFDFTRFKRMGRNLILMVLVFFIFVLPMMSFFVSHPDRFLAPHSRVDVLGEWITSQAAQTGLTKTAILLDQIKISLLAYTSNPISMFYDPGVPILRPIAAAVFLLGLGLLLLKPKDARTHLILLWLAAFVGISSLSRPVPAAQRFVAAAPGVALVVAYGLVGISDLLAHIWKGREKVLLSIAILAAAVLALDDLRFYYLDFTPNRDFSDGNTWVAHALAAELQTREDDWQVVFYGLPRMAFHSIASLPYLAPHIQPHSIEHPWGAPENPEFVSGRFIFVFLPEHEPNLRLVQADFPDGELQEVYAENDAFLYWQYTIDTTGN
ncbi:MAG: glycosyltransferase family 39 protein, partial [Anaerolineae bacterium]|nr:glycosyltransferase family 39 protein [Anaerolineae bacterium]